MQVYFILSTPIVEEGDPLELVWQLYNSGWLGNIGEGYDGAWLERFMYVGMTLLMILVLLNLLIAIMGDTFARVQEILRDTGTEGEVTHTHTHNKRFLQPGIKV